VSIVIALGSVVVICAGGEVLKATQITGTLTDGAPVRPATGVYVYVVMAGVLFAPRCSAVDHSDATSAGDAP